MSDMNGLQITNCPILYHVEIWNSSCKHFKSCEISNVSSLQSIQFGDDCFKDVCDFMLDGLYSLRTLKIGEKCFYIDNDQPLQGLCCITNCPNLCQLEIGNESFGHLEKLNLFNLNSLQSIRFGMSCFLYVDLSLKGNWIEMISLHFNVDMNWNNFEI